MIELILATLNNIMARLLDAVISWWGKELMPLSMAEMTKKMPFLATGYSIFQSMALAFAIVIAAFPSTAYSYPQANREQALSAYW